MKPYVLFTTALLFSSCMASAESNEMTQKLSTAAALPCDMRLDFGTEVEISSWRTVLDGVMGGRSTGVRFAEDGHMVFKGTINTNGGGFSSIRRSMSQGEFVSAETLKLRVRQDGRRYKLSFRTGERFRGRSVSYQLPIPQSQAGEWADVTLTLTGFDTSIFGRTVPAAPFIASEVREMGIILADGIDGPFQLDVGEIACI